MNVCIIDAFCLIVVNCSSNTVMVILYEIVHYEVETSKFQHVAEHLHRLYPIYFILIIFTIQDNPGLPHEVKETAMISEKSHHLGFN